MIPGALHVIHECSDDFTKRIGHRQPYSRNHRESVRNCGHRIEWIRMVLIERKERREIRRGMSDIRINRNRGWQFFRSDNVDGVRTGTMQSCRENKLAVLVE